MQPLLDAARRARANAHAPYSRCQVGAAIRLKSGEVFSGCNVENASYGATMCAERSAIFAAVSALGSVEIEEVVVVAGEDEPWPPCGMCRQVISEFAAPDCVVHCVSQTEKTVSRPFAELFPGAFGSAFLGSDELPR